jgi:hypothetical protein
MASHPFRNPELNQCYQQIGQLPRSRILSSPWRLQTIVAFNLERYEHLLDAYRQETAEFISTHHCDVIQ